MPVEIPKINRFETQAPQSAGRLEIQAPNLLGATAPLREGVNNLAEAGMDVYEAQQKELRKKELEAKSLKALERGTWYETEGSNYLTKLNTLQGDVTKAYEDFDKKMLEREKEAYKDLDPETSAMLREKLIRANGRLNENRTTQQTKQYYKWQNDVNDGAVKLRQDNAMRDSQFLDIKNPKTFANVYDQIGEIEYARVSVARQNGYNIPVTTTTTKDPVTGIKTTRTGYDYSEAPMIEAQIKADTGDAIIPMVKSLNAAGKVSEAKQLIKDFDYRLNAKDIATLTADNEEADVKNQALAYISTMQNRSGKAAFDEIAKSNKSDAVKFKARELVDTMDRQNESANLRKRKDAESFLYNFVDSKQTSNQPFVSIAQFKDTPQYKEYKDVLTPSEIKALEQRVQAPPVSEPAALQKIGEVFMANSFKGLSDKDFNMLLKDLNQEHRDRYTNLRNKLIKPPAGLTEAQMRARSESINGFLTQDAQLSGILPEKPINKYSEKDTEYFITKFQPAWIEYYNKHSNDEGLGDPNKQRAMVRDFIKEFTSNPQNNPPTVSWYEPGKTRQIRELPALEYWQQVPNSPLRDPENITPLGVKNISKPPAKVTKPTTSNVDLDDMVVNNPSQFKALANEYMKETGTSSLPEKSVLQAWINKRVKK